MSKLHNNINRLVEHEGGKEGFAVKIGVSFWTVRDWIDNESLPNIKNLQAIADAYKCTLDQLVEGRISLNNKGTK